MYAWPILPGKEEAWRRFIQEIQEVGYKEHTASRRRLGIQQEIFYLAQTSQAKIAIMTITADDPRALIPRLAASAHPFDHWFVRNVLELHGIDLSKPVSIQPVEPIFVWRDPEVNITS